MKNICEYINVKRKKSFDDKTETINEEIDDEEYNFDKRKKQFINFCGWRRSLRKVRPGRMKLLSENGERYVSIQCKSWDCPEKDNDWNVTTERNELWLQNDRRENRNEDFEFNKQYTYKFSFRIPKNFPLSPTRLVIWQWKFNKLDGSNESDGSAPILSQRIKKIGWNYYFIVTDSHRNQLWEKILLDDDIKGKWVDMEYKIKFSDKKDIESSVEIIANIEWKKINIYNWGYNISDNDNKFQLNPDKPHTWYFKFRLYRDNYDYAKRKIEKDGKLSEEERSILINEIEQAKNNENENPMEIHFKNFSMEDLSYDDFEQKKQKDKESKRSLILKLIERLNR